MRAFRNLVRDLVLKRGISFMRPVLGDDPVVFRAGPTRPVMDSLCKRLCSQVKSTFYFKFSRVSEGIFAKEVCVLSEV